MNNLTKSECETILDNLRTDMSKNIHKSESTLFYVANINFIRKKLDEILKEEQKQKFNT